MERAAAIQYILTAAQSLGSQNYYKKSRTTILGLSGVLFWKLASRDRQNGLSYVPKKILTWMLREALEARTRNRVTTRLSLYHTVVCSFLFLLTRVLFSPAGYAQKHASTY